MAAGGSNKDNRRGGRSGSRPTSRSGAAKRGSSPRRTSSRGESERRGSREESGRRRSDEPRGPRPPIKGRRRTFDIDSNPNDRERQRLDDGEATNDGEPTWVDEGPVRRAAGDAVRRGQQESSAPPPKGRNDKRRAQRAAKRAEGALDIDKAKLASRIGPARASRVIERLGEASDAFAQDRFEEARRTLKPLVDLVPNEPVLRELYGLTLYRLGKWKQAIVELEEFARRTGSTEQHPVLADCHRALGDHDRVLELWEELGDASPEASIIAEGRIVYAGSLADQGNLSGAIAALEGGSLGRGKLRFHHLRMRYALADLYDRAGERQSARRHFSAVAEADPSFFDVRERLAQL